MDIQASQPSVIDIHGTSHHSNGTSHHSNGVTIRPLRDTPEDRAFAADTMVEAFEGKLVHCVSREKLPIVKKITESSYHDQSAQFYTRNLVAELDGRPVGLMTLKFKGDRIDQSMDHVCELGCWRSIRLLCLASLLEFKPTSPRRCMLDALGVNASCRGRGVGKTLMERAELEARKEGCDEIYLMVLTNNIAIRLYERQGYTIRRTVGNCCMRWAAGPPGAFYEMVKPLQGPTAMNSL